MSNWILDEYHITKQNSSDNMTHVSWLIINGLYETKHICLTSYVSDPSYYIKIKNTWI